MSCKVYIFATLVAMYLFGTTDAMMDPEDITPEKADAFFVCINTIVCELGKSSEIKRMAAKPGPMLYNEGMGWLSHCFNLDMSDIDEFWKTYYAKVCNQSLDKRRECTKEMMMNYANFYEEYCEESLTPQECAKGEETITEIFQIVEEYTVSGDCNDMKEIMEETAQEMEGKMKDNAEEMAQEFVPKPPSFG